MQKIFIDYVGKLLRSKAGNMALLVYVDAFSKFVWLIPVRETMTKATIKALKEIIFCSFSVLEVLMSDNAQCFTSPYYPQPSHAERFNRNLRNALIAYHSEAHNAWDQNLTWLQLAFNMAEHESTKAAPFAVIFPFRSSSPLINQWKINELLPERCSKKSLKQK